MKENLRRKSIFSEGTPPRNFFLNFFLLIISQNLKLSSKIGMGFHHEVWSLVIWHGMTLLLSDLYLYFSKRSLLLSDWLLNFSNFNEPIITVNCSITLTCDYLFIFIYIAIGQKNHQHFPWLYVEDIFKKEIIVELIFLSDWYIAIS